MVRDFVALSEVFGPTIQGEGPSAGRRATFLRTAGCNLTCTWCDTKYTWDWAKFDKSKEVEKVSLETLGNRLMATRSIDLPPPMLVITGGEPMLQIKEVCAALEHLSYRWHGIEVETNGTISPFAIDADYLAFNVSPKMQSADVAWDMWDKENLNIISAFARDGRTACFKFVIKDEDDLDQVIELAHLADIPASGIWLMPQAEGHLNLRSGLPRWVAERAIKHGYNYSDRLHLRLWEDERGR